MTEDTQPAGPTIIPYFGYRDAAAALQWLTRAFGFEKTQAFSGPDGTVIHAEMRFGGGVIMLGTDSGEQEKQSTAARHLPAGHGIYVCVDDVDTHYERAKSAGALIIYEPENTEFGTRRYRALDLEGYEWSFGK